MLSFGSRRTPLWRGIRDGEQAFRYVTSAVPSNILVGDIALAYKSRPPLVIDVVQF